MPRRAALDGLRSSFINVSQLHDQQTEQIPKGIIFTLMFFCQSPLQRQTLQSSQWGENNRLTTFKKKIFFSGVSWNTDSSLGTLAPASFSCVKESCTKSR